MDIYTLITIFSTHFIADFIFQSRNMGRKKGKNIFWLLTHVFVYTLVTTIGWYLFLNLDLFSFKTFSIFIFLMFSTHFVTDFITSKVSGYCYLKMLENKKKPYKWEHLFWSTIGFDQLIHAITLILIYNYLYL